MTVLGKGCQWGRCCVFAAVCGHLVGIAPCTVSVLGRVGKEEFGADKQGFLAHTAHASWSCMLCTGFLGTSSSD